MHAGTNPLRIGREGDAILAIGFPAVHVDDASYVAIPISVDAPALHADALIELHGWGGWTSGLSGFLRGLSSSWRGWSGQREWHDDEVENVALVATHDGKGTISLQVRMMAGQSWPEIGRRWRAEVLVSVDASALEGVAKDVDKVAGSSAGLLRPRRIRRWHVYRRTTG